MSSGGFSTTQHSNVSGCRTIFRLHGHHPVLRAITLVQHGGLLLIIPGLLPSRSPGMTSSLIERSEVRTRSIVGLRRTNHSQQYRLTGSFVAHRSDRRTLADAY